MAIPSYILYIIIALIISGIVFFKKGKRSRAYYTL